jgi:hypothetical protein
VPEKIAEARHPVPIVRGHDFAVRIQVGDVVDLPVSQPVPVLVDTGGRVLDLSKPAAKGKLLLIVEPLIREDQHGEAVHCCVDRVPLRIRQRAAQVESFRARADRRMECSDPQLRHRYLLISPKCCGA